MSSPPLMSRSSRNVVAPAASIFSHRMTAKPLSAVAWLTNTWYVAWVFWSPRWLRRLLVIAQVPNGTILATAIVVWMSLHVNDLLLAGPRRLRGARKGPALSEAKTGRVATTHLHSR